MSQKVKAIPEGFHTVTPYLVVSEGAKAIEFYQKAFGATLVTRHNMPDGKVMHARLRIGNSIMMLSDQLAASEECGVSAPKNANTTTVTLHLYVEDADQTFDHAVKSGATVQMPVSDVFWGDRMGQVVDPFGHIWSIATQKEVLTDDEVKERAVKFFSGEITCGS